jgi:dipeptidase E
MNGTLIISGGGNAKATEIVDSIFLEHLKANQVCLIPIAKTVQVKEFRNSVKWLSNKLNSLSTVKIDVALILDLKKVISIDKNTALYFGGGNSYKLLKLIMESGFYLKLKRFLDEGGIVYGTSAGAVIMGKNISTYIDDEYLEVNKQKNYNIEQGFSLIDNFSLLTHYKKGDELRLLNYFKKYNNRVIAIPEGTALLVKNKKIKIIGAEGVYIFNSDMSKTFLSVNETIPIP